MRSHLTQDHIVPGTRDTPSNRHSAYTYAPLPSPRHTRLVVLRRGATKDPSCPLSCDLVDADVDRPPPYYALSYTWNGETPSEPLTICNTADATGTSAGGQLLITPNCAAALRVFRKSLHKRFRRRKQVTVWVDAICINQTSDHDKNVQVAMMAEIYRAAKRVIVWFGERDSPATPIPLMSSLPCALFPRGCPKGLEPIAIRLKRSVASMFFKGCNSEVALRLLLNPYWTRIWTLQEFCNDHVSMLCLNSKLLSFSGLARCDEIFYAKILPFKNKDNSKAIHQHFRYYKLNRRFATLKTPHAIYPDHAVQTALCFQASEVRDKVYALRWFSAAALGCLTVDYERPVGELFVEATRVLIQAGLGLGMLYSASWVKTTDGTGPGMVPSWTVDFATVDNNTSYRGAHMHSLSYATSRDSPPTSSISTDGLGLSMRGKRVDRVGAFVGTFNHEHNAYWKTRRDVVDATAAMDAELELPRSLTGREVDYFEETVLRHVINWARDIVRDEDSSPELEANLSDTLFELFRCLLYALNKPAPYSNLSDGPGLGLRGLEIFISKYWASIAAGLGEGRVFLTGTQRAGSGVPTLLEGDHIFVISGLGHPFILRPCGDRGVSASLINYGDMSNLNPMRN
ncbi:Heterokaryon incompatibility protein 6, OR allele [Colletotrichum orbiculare MAFF 240422]|uniref:Heterokaryon incompatibility protein 6, OR allele n=1 Tax=Colletotrichum orbiculare (strain 104-T / ATCC 96160 / CBS 514.97 / LARS 414 / MAFF 240422) TaxID=1213857 RepID=A0A484FYF3_COLOR|nr:Heterokaryon incompatibility protein 6, OR allele [Colletotrichum orbiculare MAFF 240422]